MNTRPSELSNGGAQSAERVAVRQLGVALVCAMTVVPLHAQTRMSAVYRCEGSPPTYVSSAQAALNKQCSNIGRLPQLTARRVVKDTVAKSKLAPAGTSALTAERDKPPLRTVPSTVQRDRDDDRVRVLEDELTRERQHLAELQRQMPRTAPGNGLEPSELSRQIQRVESDIAALTRELALTQRERKRPPAGSPGTV